MAKIGKNIIDIITFNLYDNPKAIFREYVQNSADAIDNAVELGILKNQNEGCILILLDKDSRTITIEDNATGIKHTDLNKKLIDVADSSKDRDVNKGFYGIGRLTGLGFCDKLIFETSFPGESVKTIVEMDSQEAHKIIFDPDDPSNASEIIDKMSSIKTESEKLDEHYFRVTIKGVHKISNDDFFDTKAIINYLELVAPVAYDRTFQTFYNGKVLPYVKDNNLKLDVYNLWLGDTQIKKCYNTSIYDKTGKKLQNDEVKDLKFMEFYTNSGEMLAWGWHSISNFNGQIPDGYQNRARGIRFRKHNIQIGNEETLKKFHKEDRGYAYFFGEIHIVHKALIPNSQRNDFTQNETYQVFQRRLKEKFVELFDYYQDASKIRSAYEAINKVKILHQQIEARKFLNNSEKEQFVSEIKNAEIEAKKRKEFLEKKKESLTADSTKYQIFENITKEYIKEDKPTYVIPIDLEQVKQNVENGKFLFDDLHKLNRAEKKLVSRVFGVIAANLPDKKLIESLAKKIKEEFNK